MCALWGRGHLAPERPPRRAPELAGTALRQAIMEHRQDLHCPADRSGPGSPLEHRLAMQGHAPGVVLRILRSPRAGAGWRSTSP